MKHIFMTFILGLAACSHQSKQPKHISRMVASDDQVVEECRIEAKGTYSTYFNVFSNDNQIRDGVSFDEASQTVKSLIEMQQCNPPEPTPKCTLSASPGYSSYSDLRTKKYKILHQADNKTALKYFNTLIELGLCEGKPIKIEDLPAEAKKPGEAKKKNDNIVVIGGRKYKVQSFWGEKTDYSSSWFSPCGSAQAEAKGLALEICMANGFPKNSCKVVVIVTLDKGGAFFALSSNVRSFCSKRVHVEGKVEVDTASEN